ncbi:MAG: DUF898 domain-containing protein [Gammaproteobacteria bacterium]|nr:DUF898 domain-containing protein [Gammaproteobacteria bacterium]
MSQVDQPQLAESTLPFEFTGSGGEYFKIWIVNLILSILTLGIYSAWAKVRTNRYFYGNTRFADSNFEYHAKPITLLKGRLVAVALFLVYTFVSQLFPIYGIILAAIFLLAMPWIIWRSIQFNSRMSSYRNVRFAFTGELKQAYKYILWLPILPLLIAAIVGAVIFFATGSFDPRYISIVIGIGVLATYLMMPYVQKSITDYYISNQKYGQGELNAKLSGKKYYMTYLALIGWFILIGIGLAIIVGVIVSVMGVDTSSMLQGVLAASQGGAADSLALPSFGIIAALYVPLLFVGVWFKAYVNSKIRNHVFSNTQLDDVLQFSSTMTVMRLFVFYSINLLLMVFTLGLAYPWVKVRIARFSANATHAHVTGSLDQFVSQQQSHQSALGDEMGEAFDVGADVGIGF